MERGPLCRGLCGRIRCLSLGGWEIELGRGCVVVLQEKEDGSN